MSLIDIIGSVFGLICVWLTVKQNNWCWPTGIVNNVFFFVLFWHGKLYCDAGLQIMYLALGAYGWYCWLHGGAQHSTLRVSRIPWREAAVLATLGVGGAWGVGMVMDHYTDTDVPFWDSSTTALCLVAQYMLAKKRIENWWVWIASNVSFFFLYQHKHFYAASWLQVVFIVLSVVGWWAWWRDLLRSENAESITPTAPELSP